MTTDEVVSRWRSPEGSKLAREVVARLAKGKPLDRLGLGQHDGRIDLRGLPLVPPTREARYEFEGFFVERLGGTVELKKRRLVGLDLSGAALTSMRFTDCVLEHCALTGAICHDWRLWGTSVVDCDLTGADLRDAAVGTGRRDKSFNRWQQVSFRGADFRVSSTFSADFVDCDFSMAKLVDVRFQQCVLQRCVFAGVLTRVQFDGRDTHPRERPAPQQPSLIDVDLSRAVLNDSQFLGCDLSRVTLPDDPQLLRIRRYPVVVEEVLAQSASDDSEPARLLSGMLRMQTKTFRSRDVDEVVNLRDYGSDDGDPLAAYAEVVFRQADAAVNGGG